MTRVLREEDVLDGKVPTYFGATIPKLDTFLHPKHCLAHEDKLDRVIARVLDTYVVVANDVRWSIKQPLFSLSNCLCSGEECASEYDNELWPDMGSDEDIFWDW